MWILLDFSGMEIEGLSGIYPRGPTLLPESTERKEEDREEGEYARQPKLSLSVFDLYRGEGWNSSPSEPKTESRCRIGKRLWRSFLFRSWPRAALGLRVGLRG